MICVIDNYDSFVYNLVQYLGELGQEVEVFRNDEISVDQIRSLHPAAVLLSPGPCTPAEAGICVELVASLAGHVPILGVCLGHQSIAAAFGANVVRAEKVMHGKVSAIHHDEKGIFRDLDNPFYATRYHSLIVERRTLPECLEVSAWTEDGLVMGIRHRFYPVDGVQFHPESILTGVGKKLLGNFLKNCLPVFYRTKRNPFT